jgi:hypothetical protein
MKTIPKKISDASLKTRVTKRRGFWALKAQERNRDRATAVNIGIEVFGEGQGLFGEGGTQVFG